MPELSTFATYVTGLLPEALRKDARHEAKYQTLGDYSESPDREKSIVFLLEPSTFRAFVTELVLAANMNAASIYDEYSVGPYFRPI